MNRVVTSALNHRPPHKQYPGYTEENRRQPVLEEACPVTDEESLQSLDTRPPSPATIRRTTSKLRGFHGPSKTAIPSSTNPMPARTAQF